MFNFQAVPRDHIIVVPASCDLLAASFSLFFLAPEGGVAEEDSDVGMRLLLCRWILDTEDDAWHSKSEISLI